MKEEIEIYNSEKLKPSTMWLLFLIVGWSYGSMGSIGKQVLYYLTLGGLGVWTLYLLFTLNSKIKKYNRSIAQRVGCSHVQMQKLGLI